MSSEKRSDRGEIWLRLRGLDAEGRARRFFRPNPVKRAVSCKVPGEGVSKFKPPFLSCCAPHEMHRGIWAIRPLNEHEI